MVKLEKYVLAIAMGRERIVILTLMARWRLMRKRLIKMKLLDPKKVKEDKNKQAEVVVKLRDAEIKLSKQINQLEDDAKILKKELDAEFESYRKKSESKKLKLQKEIVNLNTEVSDLEKRKSEALKPVEAIKKEAERLCQENLKRSEELNEREKKIAEKEKELGKSFAKLYEEEKNIGSRLASVELREKNAEKADKAVETARDSLNAEKTRYTREFAQKQAYWEAKDREIAQKEKLNEDIRLAQKAEAKRLENEQRAIEDKYAALARAKQHLGIK